MMRPWASGAIECSLCACAVHVLDAASMPLPSAVQCDAEAELLVCPDGGGFGCSFWDGNNFGWHLRRLTVGYLVCLPG